MIKTAVIYDPSGKIVRVRTGPESGVVQTAENSGMSFIYFDEIPDTENKYVEAEELVDMGEKPGAWYEFDHASKTWVLDLDAGKQEKWGEIKQRRFADEFGSFVWNDYTFDCDEVSQRRIQGAVQLAAIDSSITLAWTLADNTVQTFTAAQYVQIGQALANHVSQCHERGRILRQEIQAANTQQELEAIAW